VNKVNGKVFNVWIQNQKSLKRCALAYTRRVGHEQRARNLFGYRKKRDLALMYPNKPELVEKIIAKKKKEKLFCKDPEVEDDEEENMYWVRIDTTMTDDHYDNEETKLDMEADLDEEGLKEVTGPEGIFGGSVALNVPMMSDGGIQSFQAKLASSESGSSMGKERKERIAQEKKEEKKKEEDQNAQAAPAGPTPPIELAKQLRNQCLDESMRAAKYFMQLKEKDYSDKLLGKMEDHKVVTEQIYHKLDSLITQGVGDLRYYQPIIDCMDPIFKKFAESESVCQGMLKGVSAAASKAKPKAKTKTTKSKKAP
jgi:hypothetical protein